MKVLPQSNILGTLERSACNAGDQVRSGHQEDPLEKGMATCFLSCLENSMDRGA